ncbi:hypothetical protein AB0J84_27745 [Micromonospora arborensis]
MRPGQPLPSELHLQQTYGLARGTVDRHARTTRPRAGRHSACAGRP